MEFGITLATAADSWKVVQRAEALGFTYAWFYDTQMLNADPFVAMAAAAMQTTTINLGTGVLVPSNRIAPVTANCLASLNKLAPRHVRLLALLPALQRAGPWDLALSSCMTSGGVY